MKMMMRKYVYVMKDGGMVFTKAEASNAKKRYRTMKSKMMKKY